MGKKNKFKSPNSLDDDKSQGYSRKLARKVQRKQDKINKAIHYAKSKNTSKVCVSTNDLKSLKTLQIKTNMNESDLSNNITSALKNKILTNNKNNINCNGEGKPNKRSKKKRKNKKEVNNNKNDDINEGLNNDSSFKMSGSTNARLAKLQEYVNKEKQKMTNQENSKNSKNKENYENSKEVRNNVKRDVLIKDKRKLDDLLEGQQEDQAEITRYSNKLNLDSHKKGKIHPIFSEDFGSILEDIEDGDFEEYKHEAQKSINPDDNFKSDIMASIGKKHLTDKDDVISKSKSKNKISDQNGMNNSENSIILSESDEEIDSDEEGDKKNKNSFVDDEAEEGSDEDDDDDDDVQLVDNEEEIMFESGSCLTSNDCSTLDLPPTTNRLFDFYENLRREDEEEEEEEDFYDSDLDFIVDDDYVEYMEEEEEPVPKNKKHKKSRIINRELHSENKSECDILDREEDENEKDCNRNFKRRRILSESENDESLSPVKKQLHNPKILHGECIKLQNESTSCKNSILKKDGSNNRNSSSNNNKKSEKQVSFSLTEETKENSSNTKKIEECHEDIYGRLRDKDGNIIKTDNNGLENDGKYVPPAMRKLMALNNSSQKKEQLAQLQKKLKGQLNRLAESNMAGILSQIEVYYHSNSRNDMNDTLTKLLFEMLVTPVMTPERLIQDHALLVAVLSANIGNEVGAHILTEFVLKWVEEMEKFKPSQNLNEVHSKELDNLLMFICQLYNFNVVDSLLIYNIIQKILERELSDKEADLILLILKSVGFTLRKDDPFALKALISEINTKASECSSSHTETFSRVKFMLEILTAIRNNNMSKVPNYDPSHSQHLKSLMKGFIRKGCRTSELKISLEDLIKSKLVGKWWIVGSAWSSGLKERNISSDETKDQSSVSSVESSIKSQEETFSKKFMKKAAKLHMTRPPRINILYVLTEGAVNYEDSFEKLIELKIPLNKSQEIFNVMLYCCLRCKVYSEFYNHLALRLIKFKKCFLRLLRFSLWDTFKELDSMKPLHCSNLAKFVSNLIADDGLTLALFQKINFAEAGEGTVSFFRQTLLGIFLHSSGNYIVSKAFETLCVDSKLKSLRQYVRLFIIQFISPHKTEDESINNLLKSRVKIALDLLESVGGIKL